MGANVLSSWIAVAFLPGRKVGPPAERVAAMFVTFNTLVVRDRLDPQAVHQAFLAIDEYRRGIMPDVPGASPV